MNKVILMGRACNEPEVRRSQDGQTVIAKYSLAVNRRRAAEGQEQTADFIRITAFGKAGEFTEKYIKKGTKLLVTGHIQTGSYKDNDNKTVYTTDVIAEDQEFCESKKAEGNTNNVDQDGFSQLGMPVEVEDDDLPFAMPTR